MLKYWTTLILATMLLSWGLTWLWMAQSAPVELNLTARSESGASTEKPIINFSAGDSKNAAGPVRFLKEANTITALAPDCVVEERNSVEFRFKNEGKGPLQLQLVDMSCGCSEIRIDGQAVLKNGSAITKAGTSEGVISFTWRPEMKHFTDQSGDISRFKASIYHNDVRFSDPIVLEVRTKIRDRR